MDNLWLPYVGNSIITLAIINIAVKACARISPWAWDNILSDAFDQIIGMIFPKGRERATTGKAPDSLPE
jgi:hypothetical protein